MQALNSFMDSAHCFIFIILLFLLVGAVLVGYGRTQVIVSVCHCLRIGSHGMQTPVQTGKQAYTWARMAPRLILHVCQRIRPRSTSSYMPASDHT